MWTAVPYRRVLSALAIGLVGILIMCGCAPKEEDTGSSPTSVAVTPVSEQEPGPRVIPFFTTEADPEQISTLHSLIAEYQEADPTVEIDIILASPSSRGRRLLTALASGADLGIFEIEPALMTDWVEAGYLLPLTDIVDHIGRDDYVAGSLFEHEGEVYAIPYATSVYGLWVRTDILAEHDLPLPTSYDDVIRIAETVTDAQLYGLALPAGQNIASVNYFSTVLWQNGADYFTCDGDVAFGSPLALEAVEKWAALLEFAPPGAATWGYGEQIDAFLRGRVAMAMYAGRLGTNLVEQAPKLEDKVDVVFPSWGPVPVTLGVWSRLAIAAGTRHQAEAKAFLQWLLSGDRLLRYDITVPGHMIPALRSIQAEALASDTPYVREHGAWLRAFDDWVEYTNHPVMNMGSVADGRFKRVDVPPPWAGTVFGTTGIISNMLQEIALAGSAPEVAWRHAVIELEKAVADWKEQHPKWLPPVCE